jgi:hypothetical protein
MDAWPSKSSGSAKASAGRLFGEDGHPAIAAGAAEPVEVKARDAEGRYRG